KGTWVFCRELYKNEKVTHIWLNLCRVQNYMQMYDTKVHPDRTKYDAYKMQL
ncbi:hypothetical protein SAMN05216514_12322, partial [Kandleria vitulina]